MIIFASLGLLLLVAGLTASVRGNWRMMWGAQAYMAVFVTACLSVDYWYQLAGISRGDGFGLIGIMMVGVASAGIAIGALLLAGIIRSLRGARAATAQVEGKSQVE